MNYYAIQTASRPFKYNNIIGAEEGNFFCVIKEAIVCKQYSIASYYDVG